MLESLYIKRLAVEAGFDLCGIARCRPFPENERRFRSWLAEGYNSSLDYLARNLDKRFDPARLVEGARTAVVCAVGYKNEASEGYPASCRTKIASYALTTDYHTTIRQMLRDMLGALMGCGIRREAVGDLCLQPHQCDLFVTAELAPYLLDNLTSAGRAHLTLTRIAPSQAERPPQTLQELRVTVSSPRLDSVISAAFHLSRGSAADAVAAGRVNLNDLPCLKPDRAVQENDTVSVRGLGKLRVLALGGLTKKGRLALTLGKYL